MRRENLNPVRAASVVALLVAAGCGSVPRHAAQTGGVVVEKVTADGVAARAGVEVGDVLVRWRQGSDGGELVSPFDLDQVRVEESPRGAVTLAATRGDQALSFELGDGSWGLDVLPRLGEEGERALAEARQTGGAEGAERLRALAGDERRPAVRAWLLVVAAEAAGLGAADELWSAAAESVKGDPATRGRVEERHAATLRAAGRLTEAAAAFSRALESRPEGSLAAARSLNDLGNLARDDSDLDMARSYHQRALEIRRVLAPDSLAVAASLNNLGNVAWARGDLAAAEKGYRQALEIKQRLVPDSLDVARTLDNLGLVAEDRGDLAAAERTLGQALEIEQRLAPASLAVAGTLNNLGNVAKERGDLETAEGRHKQALRIRERLAPAGLDVAYSLNNLGLVVYDRGDLEAAEGYYRRALEIKERLAPGSLAVADSLHNVGNVAFQRGDLEAAEGYYRRALVIKERLAPGSLDVATTLNNLGAAAGEHDDLEAAAGYYRRALETVERLAPGSLTLAMCLNNLGQAASQRGDLEAAEGLFARALEIRERLAPAGLDVAASLNDLGQAGLERGDLEAAETDHRRALAIFERLAPGSAGEAATLHELARVLRAGGRRSEALDALRRALEALEAQQRRLGGTAEQLGEFRAKYLDIYRDLVDLLIEEGLPEQAFAVVESARARALLAMLAERDIMAHDVPPDLERQRRIANADHDRTMSALGQLSGADEPERQRLLTELDVIRQRQDDIRARVRAASPRLADLRYPEPLDLAATRQTLDPGTLLLEFSVGMETSHLFAVGPGPERFAVYPLASGEEQLTTQVARLRRLLQPGAMAVQARRQALTQVLQSLSRTLIGPARAEIADCSRVIVVPDGPLHLLPFAVLLDPADPEDRYLVEAKPLSVVASATVLAQLEARPRPQREPQLTAFGDPRYPPAGSAELPTQPEQARRSGLSLDPLPATRAEVESLGRLYGEHATVWLAAEATEERAKAVGQAATLLHFAAHGIVDERRPLSSALALAIPEQVSEGQENGVLEAWEVFEQVRLDADLVTLSACDTALGKEVAGEGIVGLTRAFQYAGARSVLASLWSVADESTAELMRRFYANLKAGMAKDEALRQAQLAFIGGSVETGGGDTKSTRDLSHPFYWAAFQLYGDWR